MFGTTGSWDGDASIIDVTPKSSEAKLQMEVIRYALAHGWLLMHIQVTTTHGQIGTHTLGDNGYPDLTLARNGVVWFFELKSQRGTLSKEQKAWGEALGDRWRCWMPKDALEIMEVLR